MLHKAWSVSSALCISQGSPSWAWLFEWLAVIYSVNERFDITIKMTLMVMELKSGPVYLIQIVPLPRDTPLAHFQSDFIPVITTNEITQNYAEGIITFNLTFKWRYSQKMPHFVLEIILAIWERGPSLVAMWFWMVWLHREKTWWNQGMDGSRVLTLSNKTWNYIKRGELEIE